MDRPQLLLEVSKEKENALARFEILSRLMWGRRVSNFFRMVPMADAVMRRTINNDGAETKSKKYLNFFLIAVRALVLPRFGGTERAVFSSRPARQGIDAPA